MDRGRVQKFTAAALRRRRELGHSHSLPTAPAGIHSLPIETFYESFAQPSATVPPTAEPPVSLATVHESWAQFRALESYWEREQRLDDGRPRPSATVATAEYRAHYLSAPSSGVGGGGDPGEPCSREACCQGMLLRPPTVLRRWREPGAGADDTLCLLCRQHAVNEWWLEGGERGIPPAHHVIVGVPGEYAPSAILQPHSGSPPTAPLLRPFRVHDLSDYLSSGPGRFREREEVFFH